MGFLTWLREFLKGPEEYGTPSVTLTCESVRSKGERIIADYLTRHNIAYKYEALATTNDWFIFKSKISRPDFYLPQYDVYIEYWGLVDAEDWRPRDTYIKSMRWKMAQYHENSIKFVSIYPSNLSSLNYYFRKKFKEVKGFNLP